MKQLSGKYGESEFVRRDGARNETKRNAEHSIKLNSSEWDEIVQKLAVTFNKSESQLSNGRDGSLSRPSRSARPAIASYQTLPVRKLSSLQEDESRYYATAILSKTTDRIKLATVSWLKEPLAVVANRKQKSHVWLQWQSPAVTIRFLQYRVADAPKIPGRPRLAHPMAEHSILQSGPAVK